MTSQKKSWRPSVRVYGPTRGNSSWPRVTAGLVAGLKEIGALNSFCSTDDVGHRIDGGLTRGFDAPVAIHVGPPSVAGVMRGLGDHQHRLALIAVNSSWAPRNAMASLESGEEPAVTGYLAPSSWAVGVLQENTTLPVFRSQHGVSSEFSLGLGEWKGGMYPRECNMKRNSGDPRRPPPRIWGVPRCSVLHMSSTHHERKGTAKLIKAWAVFVDRIARRIDSLSTTGVAPGSIPSLDSLAKLTLVCDGPRSFFNDAIIESIRPSMVVGRASVSATISVEARKDLGVAEMRDFYRSHSLVCQPSRSEGFGMVPLEARLSGVPVIMTNGTGHDDHIPVHYLGSKFSTPSRAGIVVVKNDGCHPIDDGPGATAPDFSVSDLAYALSTARHDIVSLTDCALGTARHMEKFAASGHAIPSWSWAEVSHLMMMELSDGGLLE